MDRIKVVTYNNSSYPHRYQREIIHLLSPNLKVEWHDYFCSKVLYKTEHTLVASYAFLTVEEVVILAYMIDSSTENLRQKLLTMTFEHSDPACYEGFPSFCYSTFVLKVYTKKDLQDHHLKNIEEFVRKKREDVMTAIEITFDYFDYSYEIKK